MENDHHYFKKGPLKGAGRESTKKIPTAIHAKAFNLYFRSTKNMGDSGFLENGPFFFLAGNGSILSVFEHVKLYNRWFFWNLTVWLTGTCLFF